MLKFIRIPVIISCLLMLHSEAWTQNDCNAFLLQPENVIDGSFETTSTFSGNGWYIDDSNMNGSSIYSLPNPVTSNNQIMQSITNIPDGDSFVILNATTNAMSFKNSQPLNIVPGNYYTLTFSYRNVTVEAAAADLGSWHIKIAQGSATPIEIIAPYIGSKDYNWDTYSYTFLATASSLNLYFKPKSNITVAECYMAIDDIALFTNCPEDAEPPAQMCSNCTSFSPEQGKRYIIGGWVKSMIESGIEFLPIASATSYPDPFIKVSFEDGNSQTIGVPLEFHATGRLIDGWQRIQGEFTIPNNIEDIKIGLYNINEDHITFFDDIRVHPYDSNIKSFVYDQKSQKLMAEMDENNYATFYEYDKEGGLIRIKKETEQGVMTVQETRSSTRKAN